MVVECRKYTLEQDMGQRILVNDEHDRLREEETKTTEEQNMKLKNLRSILYTVVAFAAIAIFSTTGRSQSISLDAPEDGSRLNALARVGGTSSGVAQVRFSIGKAESDEVWNCNWKASRNRCGWRTGPTGQWMNAVITPKGWEADPRMLPSGKSLPNGRYVIHIYGRNSGGDTVVEQSSHSFIIGPE